MRNLGETGNELETLAAFSAMWAQDSSSAVAMPAMAETFSVPARLPRSRHTAPISETGRTAERMAWLSASLPPEVKVIPLGDAPIQAAIRSLASSRASCWH